MKKFYVRFKYRKSGKVIIRLEILAVSAAHARREALEYEPLAIIVEVLQDITLESTAVSTILSIVEQKAIADGWRSKG